MIDYRIMKLSGFEEYIVQHWRPARWWNLWRGQWKRINGVCAFDNYPMQLEFSSRAEAERWITKLRHLDARRRGAWEAA